MRHDKERKEVTTEKKSAKINMKLKKDHGIKNFKVPFLTLAGKKPVRNYQNKSGDNSIQDKNYSVRILYSHKKIMRLFWGRSFLLVSHCYPFMTFGRTGIVSCSLSVNW